MSYKKTITVLTAGAAFAGIALAADPQPANYFGLHGGINDLRGSWSGDVNLGAGVSLPGTVGLKRGSQFGLQLGRQMSNNWRFEGEYQHGTFDLTRIELGGITESQSKSGSYDALTANAYRTASLTSNLSAFGGLGIGWGRVKLPQMGFTSGCNCFADASKSGLAWQARAGLEYAVTPNDNVFAQYTFLGLPRPSSGGSPGVQYERKNVSSIGIGYRRTF